MNTPRTINYTNSNFRKFSQHADGKDSVPEQNKIFNITNLKRVACVIGAGLTLYLLNHTLEERIKSYSNLPQWMQKDSSYDSLNKNSRYSLKTGSDITSQAAIMPQPNQRKDISDYTR